MIRRVPVDLPGRAYDVLIGPGLLSGAGARVAALSGSRPVAILTDETVASHHLGALQASLSAAGVASDALVLPRARPPRAGRSCRAAWSGCSSGGSSAVTW